MIQSIQFSSTDIRPYYYTEVEKNKHKLDINTGKNREVDFMISELIANMKIYDIIEPTGYKSKLKV